MENFIDDDSIIWRYSKVICQLVVSIIVGVCGYFFYNNIYDVYDIKSKFLLRVYYYFKYLG